MKRNKTTKMTAVLLCAAMLLMALVSGCGGGGTPSDVDKAKEALIGTWYNKFEDDEGNDKWSNTEYTFYENGTMCEKDNQETWYTWELLSSEEAGKYTLMTEKKRDYASSKREVDEIQFDGNEHFSVVSGYSYALYGKEFYKNKG